MRIMPVNNQNNYRNQTSFKNLITIKPDVAVPFETLTCYKKDGFGYILRRIFVPYENLENAVKEALTTLKYRLSSPEEDFIALVRNAHKNEDNSLAERYLEQNVQEIRPHIMIEAQFSAKLLDTSLA